MSQPRPIRQVDVGEAAERLAGGGASAQDEMAGSADVAASAGTDAAAAHGPLLVDVREADELAVLRVPGSVHVPLSDFATASESLPRDRPLLLLCASGRRSLVAAEYLQRHGHDDVASVVGGIIEWQKRGLPTAGGPLPPPRESSSPSG